MHQDDAMALYCADLDNTAINRACLVNALTLAAAAAGGGGGV